MSMTDTTSDDESGTENDYLRNEPSGTFDAHLFTRAEVEAAGGAVGEQADRPASSICSRTTAYGPFAEVEAEDVRNDLPDHDGGVCGVCARLATEGEENES